MRYLPRSFAARWAVLATALWVSAMLVLLAGYPATPHDVVMVVLVSAGLSVVVGAGVTAGTYLLESVAHRRG